MYGRKMKIAIFVTVWHVFFRVFSQKNLESAIIYVILVLDQLKYSPPMK